MTENVPLTPTSDRTRMFAMGGCCPGEIWVYTAATDTFTGPTFAGELPYRASFDAAAAAAAIVVLVVYHTLRGAGANASSHPPPRA